MRLALQNSKMQDVEISPIQVCVKIIDTMMYKISAKPSTLLAV